MPKYIRKTFTYNGKRYEVRGNTEREAFEKLGDLKAAVKRGEVGICSKMTVNAWSEEWLKTYVRPRVRKAGEPKRRNTMTEKSYSTYTDKLDLYILPVIGYMRISDVKDTHLQRILNRQAGQSFSTASKIKNVMTAMFRQAYASRIIQFDPSTNLTLPATTTKKRRSLTEEERAVLLKVAETHRCGLWIRTLLRTGMRPAESAALLVSDLDFGKNLIHVCKSVESGTKVVSTPKTEAGNRYIPIPKDIREDLKCAVKQKKPSDYVFPQTDGVSMMTSACIDNNWAKFARQMDLEMGALTTSHGHIYDPKDLFPDGTPKYPDKDGNPIDGHVLDQSLTLYDLRHTYATDLARNKIPIDVAKTFLGHSSITMTADIYNHFGDADDASEYVDSV